MITVVFMEYNIQHIYFLSSFKLRGTIVALWLVQSITLILFQKIDLKLYLRYSLPPPPTPPCYFKFLKRF
jgi:hypothetical protein